MTCDILIITWATARNNSYEAEKWTTLSWCLFLQNAAPSGFTHLLSFSDEWHAMMQRLRDIYTIVPFFPPSSGPEVGNIDSKVGLQDASGNCTSTCFFSCTCTCNVPQGILNVIECIIFSRDKVLNLFVQIIPTDVDAATRRTSLLQSVVLLSL